MQMYYHTFDEAQGRFVVCRAASKDGLQWSKQGPCFAGAPEGEEDAFDALGAASHHVVRDAPSRRCRQLAMLLLGLEGRLLCMGMGMGMLHALQGCDMLLPELLIRGWSHALCCGEGLSMLLPRQPRTPAPQQSYAPATAVWSGEYASAGPRACQAWSMLGCLCMASPL